MKIADLKFRILADLSKLKEDIKKTFQEKLKIDVGTTGGVTAGAGGKKGLSLLGTIAKRLLPLGILVSLKPLATLLEAFLGFAAFGILKILKFLNNIGNVIDFLRLKFVEIVDKLRTKFVEKVDQLRLKLEEVIRVWVGKAVNFLRGLPSQIWRFLRGLAPLIWEKLKVGFEVLRVKLGDVGSILKAVPSMIWAFLKRGFEVLKVVLGDVGSFIAALPAQIWAFLKQLPALIASALKKIIVIRVFPSRKVDDVIITKGGQVLETSPDDTIIATKNPGGVGGNVTNNFFGVTPQEMIDVIRRELGVDTNRATRF